MRSASRKQGRRVAAALAVVLLLATVAALAAGARYMSPYAAMRMDLSLLATADAVAPSTLLAYDPTLRADRVGPLHAVTRETLWGGASAQAYRLRRYAPRADPRLHIN
jgi:hypothetical protein